MYLVDTNVLSEARRGSKEARIWLRSIDATTIYLSVITLGEIMKGIALKLRADARAAAGLTAWLGQLWRDHSDRILPITDGIALEWGRLAAARSRRMADGLIAATALVHTKIIVTRNAEDPGYQSLELVEVRMLRERLGEGITWLTCALALSLCLASSASAQEAAKAPLVGVLLINTATDPEPAVPLFRDALAGLGYIEGRNLRLDLRFAEGHTERFPALAAALVGDKPAVIVALGDAATRAAQQATRTIPIVAGSDDLVADGLIQSMAKPGGNTTGISILATELDAKKVEILNEIVPTARRFALLRDPASSTEARLRAIAAVARTLALELQTVDVDSPADFEAAFARLRAGGVEALDILASPLLANFQSELGRLSLEYKLPAICQFREMVEAGCLASYGVKRTEMYAMLAAYTDKMLKGAKPGDTVAQQPSAVELVINQKTARKLGIELPPAILARADEVIE